MQKKIKNIFYSGWRKGMLIVKKESNGFTIIEMMVVLAIFGLILGVIVIDFASQRPNRDMKIAQNELITNIRKVQSYSLLSTNLGSQKSAQFYVIKFDQSFPDRYFIQTISDAPTSPKLSAVETVKFPSKVRFASSTPFAIDRPGLFTDPVAPACVLVAFKSPFAKILISEDCNITTPPFSSGDSYRGFIEFVNNVNGISVSSDTDFLVSLEHQDDSSIIKKVLIKGITGLICSTNDGLVCAN